MASHNHSDAGSNDGPAIPLPDWAQVRLGKFTCSVCGRTQKHTDIVATGLRAGPSGRGVFFLESVCHQCRTPAVCVFEGLPFDADTFAIGLTLAMRNGRTGMKPVSGSMFDKWTDHASDAVADELESLGSHDDFLRKIGLTPAQIDEWATYRGTSQDAHRPQNPDSTKE